jgi:hypothetical protein
MTTICFLRRVRPWLAVALALVAVLAAPTGMAQPRANEAERVHAYRLRADSLIDFYTQQIDPADRTQGGYVEIAANLYRGTNLDWCVARLDTLVQHPRGDMFWMYPTVLVSYLGRDALPEATRRKMRDLWRTYRPYRGDTENHWAMYYSSLYLITQLYPNEPGDAWFNGRSSRENHEEARDYLLSWIDLTTTKGQGEFDSPVYIAFFLVAMSNLYAYADDPAMRLRAQMMLDYLLADFATESLDGAYVGAFSRIYPDPLVDRWNNNSTSFAWLLFGNTPFLPRGESVALAMSGYEPPAVLTAIATDRAEPYVHRELKRTRHRIRYSDVKNERVYKTTFVRPEYAVGSIQGGLLQPIQQHTWEVFWRPEHPKDSHTMVFATHPYSSSHELAMYFPEEPENLTEAVSKSKSTYDQPDKWASGSPYEQVMQDEDALIALYDIEFGTRFPFISGFFPKALAAREKDASGWIFARGGDALIAYYPLAPYEWREEEDVWRLHSTALKNGAVVQVAPASAYDSFEAFKAAVRALPLETATEPVPSVRFTALHGRELASTYGETPTIDGQVVDYEGWPLFDGPFMHADPGSRTLDLHDGPLHRRLDFDALTITDWVDEPARRSRGR